MNATEHQSLNSDRDLYHRVPVSTSIGSHSCNPVRVLTDRYVTELQSGSPYKDCAFLDTNCQTGGILSCSTLFSHTCLS